MSNEVPVLYDKISRKPYHTHITCMHCLLMWVSSTSTATTDLCLHTHDIKMLHVIANLVQVLIDLVCYLSNL